MKKINPRNILSVRSPSLCKEWNYKKNNVNPKDVSVWSHDLYWWICDNGHEWKASINHRIRGSGCPNCSGNKVCIDNCLATANPRVALEWDVSKNKKLTPYDVTCGSNKMAWWACAVCGNKWRARIDSRKNTGCPKCLGVIKGWEKNRNKSLAYKNPELIKEWHPTKNRNLTPFMLMPNSHRKVQWVCEKNHEWVATPHDRIQHKSSCPYCDGKKVCIDNCLATVNPELTKEWHPTKNGKLTPRDVTGNSGKRVVCLCRRCGREWTAHISNRSKGHGCECYRNAVLKDGTICDSMIEALFYLRLKNNKIKFIHHGLYGEKMGKHSYDFYIPKTNTYIEVTSYHDGSLGREKYFETIKNKEEYVRKKINANFEFIQYTPTKKEYQFVRDNLKTLLT